MTGAPNRGRGRERCASPKSPWRNRCATSVWQRWASELMGADYDRAPSTTTLCSDSILLSSRP
jgi:hypothetical protein